MAHLEHLFAAGMRFETEVQYQVRSANELTYENLLIHKSASSRTCAIASMAQCIAVLSQMPARQARELMRVAQSRLRGSTDGLDDAGMLRTIEVFCKAVTQLHSAIDGEDLGSIAQNALREGQVCLLGFDSVRSSRWAMVTGVELDRLNGQTRALLLLDSSAGEPWACSHNVRVELHADAGRAVRASPGFTLNCRHLTGEACAVRLRSLIVLCSAQD